MALIAVGQRLFPNKNSYPEGVAFEYTQSGPMLIIAFRNPKPSEIEAAKSGKLEMAFYESGPIIFVMVKIKGMGGWMDAPFSIRIYDQRGATFDWSDSIGEGQGLGVHIVLVDANTGIVKAQRLIGTSTEFAHGLRAAIMRQYEMPFSVTEYDATIRKIYQNLSSEDMAARADFRFVKR
jgi:hypothetical protein